MIKLLYVLSCDAENHTFNYFVVKLFILMTKRINPLLLQARPASFDAMVPVCLLLQDSVSMAMHLKMSRARAGQRSQTIRGFDASITRTAQPASSMKLWQEHFRAHGVAPRIRKENASSGVSSCRNKRQRTNDDYMSNKKTFL